MEFLTSEQVAKQLCCSSLTVLRLARDRKIDVVLLPGYKQKRFFTQEAIDKYIKEHTLIAKPKEK